MPTTKRLIAATGPLVYVMYSSIDYRSRLIYESLCLAHRGASPETILKAERGVASRGAARNRMFGRHGHRPPGTTTRAARSSLHALRRQCRSRKRGAGAQKPPRWSAERRASYVIGREAPRKRLARRVKTGRTDAQRRIRAPVGAPPTPRGGKLISRPRAQLRRGNEMCCLTS